MVVLSFLLLVRNRVFCACGTQLKTPKYLANSGIGEILSLNLRKSHFKPQFRCFARGFKTPIENIKIRGRNTLETLGNRCGRCGR